MKRKDYYELLEITPQASNMDIIHAYRQAKLAFQQDSLAAYGLFPDSDMEELRALIDEAYQTLSDPEKRREYDAQRHLRASRKDDGSPPVPGTLPHPPSDSIQHRIASATDFPGSFLREIRESKDLTIQSIADHTRISKQYLNAIEAEEQSQFPEPVYLRGYLRQYARELGLDAEQVVKGYPPISGRDAST